MCIEPENELPNILPPLGVYYDAADDTFRDNQACEKPGEFFMYWRQYKDQFPQSLNEALADAVKRMKKGESC